MSLHEQLAPEQLAPDQHLPERLRVLFVSPSLQAGGAEQHLVRLLNHLDRRRFDITLALHRSGGAFEDRLAEDLPKVVLQPERPMSSFQRMLQAVPPLRRWMATHRPQVVCAVQNHAGVATLMACRRLAKGVPPPAVAVVVQNHLGQKFARQGWRPTSRLLAALMGRFYPRADRLVAASQGVAEDLRRRFPGCDDRLQVIYNAGFDDDGTPTAPQGMLRRRPEAPLLVACGRLVEQKGFDLLLDAVARLPQGRLPQGRLPQDRLPPHLWILGEGPARSKLERRARRLGLGERLWMPGFLPDPRPYMALADVFVMPSRWEGFGNVLVEAMACGVPVVASDCPSGPREILDDGSAGRLVPTNDVAALASAIDRLLRSPTSATELAQHGRQRAMAFSTGRAVAAYSAMLQSMAEERHEGAAMGVLS